MQFPEYFCQKRCIKSFPIRWQRLGCSVTIRYNLIFTYSSIWFLFVIIFIFRMIFYLLSSMQFDCCRNFGVYQNLAKKMKNTAFQLMNWRDLIHYCEMRLIREHAIQFISEKASFWSIGQVKIRPHQIQRCTFLYYRFCHCVAFALNH